MKRKIKNKKGREGRSQILLIDRDLNDWLRSFGFQVQFPVSLSFLL